MRRMVSLLLLVCFLMLGSGAALYLHELDHLREDAREAALARGAGLPVPDHPDHDDNSCPIHRQLHLPMIHVPCPPAVLALLGTTITFLGELHSQVRSTKVLAVIDCRGPPLLSAPNLVRL